MIEFELKLEAVPVNNNAINLFEAIDKQNIKQTNVADGFEMLEVTPAGSCEQLLYLEAHHNLGDKVTTQQAEFIVLVDKSGSMQGGPWRQVQSALIQMLDLTKNTSTCRAISYNQDTQKIPLTGHTATDKAAINSIRAGGSTNFVAVFNELANIFKDKNEDASRNFFIFLMTDGLDTCNQPREIMSAKEQLQAEIQKFGAEVVVNVLGFSEDHDEDFLESLTVVGTSDGTYSYVSPSEGDKALEERLVEMVQTASSIVGRNINIEVVSENVEFLGDWFGEKDKDVVLPAMLTTKNGITKIATRKFVKIPEGAEPKLTIRLFEKLSGNAKPMEAKIGKLTTNVLEKKEEIDAHNLRKLRTAMNMITSKMSEVEEGKEDDEVKAWYKVVKAKMSEMKSSDKNVPEIARLHKIMDTGMEMCAAVMEPGRVKEEERSKTRKAMSYNYQMKSKNIMNKRNVKKEMMVEGASTNKWLDKASYTRNSLQKKVKQTDYTMDSDEEEA